MVYGKRSRRSRKGYRTRRTLSTRNIFSHKNARAQASQIYRLNRKVNSIYRQCKPELRVKETGIQSFTMTSYGINIDDPANFQVDFTNPKDAGHIFNINMPISGTLDSDFTGNSMQLKDMTVYLSSKYELLKDARLTSLPNIVSDQVIIRYVFFLTKTPTDDVIEPTDLFELSNPGALGGSQNGLTLGYYPPGYNMNTLLPLRKGTASKFVILKDLRVKVGVLNPDKQIRVKLSLGKYHKYITNAFDIFGKCDLHCMAVVSSLDMKGVNDAQGNYIYAIPRIRFDYFTKIAFTDP